MQNNYRYKDSGIEWLGEIPSHWNVKRLKRVCALTYGDSLPDDNRNDGQIPVYGSNGIVGFHDENNTLSPSIVVGRKGSYGMLNYSSDKAFAIDTTYYIDANTTTYDIRWLYYALLCLRLDEGSKDSAVPGLAREDAYKHFLPDCNLLDQQAIAAFLDRETSRIDALIQKKERLIELLKEKRIALITQAFTKGLDPNVPMKDSGIEWLGEVPEHWKVLPIKYIVSTPVTDGPHETPEILDEGVPFISAESIKGGKIDFELKRGFISIEDDLRFSKKYKPVMHDIYVIKSGATTGNSAMVETDVEFNIWSPLAVIRCHKAIADPHFVFLYVNSKEFITAIQLFWSFGTQQNIGMNIIENLQVPLPPISEQINICKESKMELERIETLQNRIADSITLLREYRSSLINAAITGKIDLREAL